MPPLQATSPPLGPALKSRTTPTMATNAVSQRSPKDIKLPPSPEHESTSSMSTLSLQMTTESEGDVESENELPTMTPPSKSRLPPRPRNSILPNGAINTSPLPGNSFAVMPPMQRAHSSPGADYNHRVASPTLSYPRRPASPLGTGRRRSPLRSTYEEAFPASAWNSISIEPNIPEHAELELSTPVTPENEFGNISTMPTYTSISNTYSRSRRRPTSPLHQSASAPSLHTSARAAGMNPTSGTPPSYSSSFPSTRYANEPYPAYGYSISSASSMPSTPTSLRSRSPSISSLETIEDTPDAEEAAMMDEENAKSHDVDSGPDLRRKSLDLRVAGLRSNKDRKRWSVCGAERRADFSLEPIEE